MTEPDDDARAAEQIAAALGRLRGAHFGRPGGPRFGGGPFEPGGPWTHGRRGSHDPSGSHGNEPHGHDPHHAHGHDAHGGPHGHGRGGPWREDQGPMGRSGARLRLLEALAAASAPLSVSEVAERVGVDQPRASRLVQAGVEAGHVRREADPVDARRTNLVLTDAGKALIAQFRGARIGAVEAALETFTTDERAQLAALLGRLADAWPRG